MSDLKTKPTDASVSAFLDTIENEKKRKEAYRLLEIFKEATKEEPKMWGASIIGFGQYHYRYQSGREGYFMLTGFSPRKAKHSLYILSGFKRFEVLLEELGKYKTAKACLYINKLEDIDQEVLKNIIQESVQHMREKYG